MSEKFGPLNFETFIEAWKDADTIAKATIQADEYIGHERLDGVLRAA